TDTCAATYAIAAATASGVANRAFSQDVSTASSAVPLRQDRAEPGATAHAVISSRRASRVWRSGAKRSGDVASTSPCGPTPPNSVRPNATNSAATTAASHCGRTNAPVTGSIAGSQPPTLPDACPIQGTPAPNWGRSFARCHQGAPETVENL